MWGTLSGIVTGLLILSFLGLFVWAWSRAKKRSFDEAAQLALDPEDREIPVDEMEQRS